MFRGIYLVIAVTTFFPLGMVVTYTLAVLSSHVKPLCYISYTGNYPIESCIFSFVLNTCSAGYTCIVFLRYVQLSEALTHADISNKGGKWSRLLNFGSLLLGAAGALGLSVAGNFQQHTFHLLHIIGVFFCTYSTLGFMFLQTYFSFAFPFLATSFIIKILRLVVLFLALCILTSGPIFAIYYNFKTNRSFNVLASDPPENDPGLPVGAVYEWTLFFLNQIYIASLCPDFRKITLKSNKIVFLG